MLQTALSGFIMLLVTVGPLEAAAIFAGLTAGRTTEERRRIAVRAILVATVVLAVFAVGGMQLLNFLHISLPAFRLAGGLLLLLVAIDLMFVHPTGLTSITSDEAQEAGGRDIAVFPLAIPLLAGPGSMTAAVLLMTDTRSIFESGAILVALVGAMAVTLLALFAAAPMMRLLGVTGVNVVARVSGVILASLAMQLMIDGLRESGVFSS